MLRLDIPAGAVAEETAFEITLVTDVPGAVAELDPVGGVYDVQPEGTVFEIPATLTWSFASTPSGARNGDGDPFVLFAGSFTASGELAFNANTETDVGANTVLTEIDHLSIQFFTPKFSATGEPVAAITADLKGGEHFVSFPWSANAVFATPSEPNSVALAVDPTTEAPLEPMNDAPDWDKSLLFFPGPGYSANDEWIAGVSSSLTSMPRWQCTAVGSGPVKLAYNALVAVGAGASVGGTLRFSEPVTCVVREEKPEYLAERATLTEARIETITTPATVMKDLATTQGSFGYFIHIPAGQTIEVCVTTTGSAAVNYFPHFPPGFTFVDGAPGCTRITSMDPDLPNDVLVVVTGSGTITVTTTVVSP